MAFNKAIDNTKKVTFTDNGMATLLTSNSGLVDMFFNAGAMRTAETSEIANVVSKALSDSDNPVEVYKTLFWARDIRGGAGERRFFRESIKFMMQDATHVKNIRKLLPLIPMYGRWDDLLIFLNTKLENDVVAIIKYALDNGNGLCAKWMPRKGEQAVRLRNALNMTPKQYRKTLVTLTKVVETQMCAKEWSDIEYGAVPSVAAARYQTAFMRNDEERYSKYRDALISDDPEVAATEKINAGAVYPYDIIRSLNSNSTGVGEAQWKALENFLPEGSRILPMVDTSGSMDTPVSGSVTAMDVAVSLGLYIAERQTGAFKGAWLNFSGKSTIRHIKGGSLKDRYQSIRNDSNWGMSTNILSAFESILTVGKQNNLTDADMPDCLIIFSDMQFDHAAGDKQYPFFRGETSRPYDESAQEIARKLFTDAGYKLPQIVYWNLVGSGTQAPVTFDESGTVLVSGFSPSLLKPILSLDVSEFTPYNMVKRTIDSDRYAPIADALQ